jgi:rubrerythrin
LARLSHGCGRKRTAENWRYLAFAEKDEQEGYGDVASLFRAAAQAEQIHADNHAAVLKGMGIVALPKIGPVKILSTKENLVAAIEGESYE